MTCLKVRILRIWDTDLYPGFAECLMLDALGAEHYFRDKIPIFSDQSLTPELLPCDGLLRCKQCQETTGGLIQVDTEFPDHVSSTEGEHLFLVSPHQLQDLLTLPDHIRAHRFSSNHRAQLSKDPVCGCFHCLSIFDPKEILDWLEPEGTALCPYCGIDSVIGQSSGYPITKDLLQKMKDHWF